MISDSISLGAAPPYAAPPYAALAYAPQSYQYPPQPRPQDPPPPYSPATLIPVASPADPIDPSLVPPIAKPTVKVLDNSGNVHFLGCIVSKETGEAIFGSIAIVGFLLSIASLVVAVKYLKEARAVSIQPVGRMSVETAKKIAVIALPAFSMFLGFSILSALEADDISQKTSPLQQNNWIIQEKK